MGYNDFFNGLFFDDIDLYASGVLARFATKKTDAALSFASNQSVWLPKIIRKEKLVSSVHKEVLIRSSFEKKYLPYQCEPKPESKYNDEIQLNIDNCEADHWDVSGNAEWQLKDKSGQTYRKYPAVCGEPFGGKEVFANYSDILPKIPTLNNNYVNSGTLYDNYPNSNLYPAHKQYDGIGIKEFAQYFASTKNIESHPPIVIDWIISEKIGEIPFDGVETHHDDVTTHKKAYNRFLQTNKTCGNFISLDFISQSSGVTYLTKDLLPDIDDFTIPYGNKQPTINNIFIGKEKVASHWNWTYEEAVLCWYRHNASPTVDPVESLASINKDIYVSDGDVFIATNINPIKVLKNNIIQYILPINGRYLYISQNIYSKFIKILERLENKNPSFALLKPEIKVQTAALYATGPSYDEITLDTVEFSDFSTSIEKIYSNYGFRGNQIDKKNIQNFLDLNTQAAIYEDIYTNSSSSGLLSITNSVMTNLLNKDFRHDQQLSNLNYATNLPELLTILNHKYGSYIKCTAGNDKIVFKNQPDQQNLAIDLDFEILMQPRGVVTEKQITCGSFGNSKTIGYNQEIKINNHVLSTNIVQPVYNKNCISGKFTTTEIARPINLQYANNVLDSKILTTGSPQTIYQDTYYRGSYELALLIDGESLCQNSKICDKRLKDKYYPTYKDENGQTINDDVIAREFVDNDIKIKRVYDRILCNPNIHLIGMQNNTIYTESNIFNDETYVSSPLLTESRPEIRFNIVDNSCIIKIYNINIPYLRSFKKPGCKTLPINNRCKCHAINLGYSYGCSPALEINIPSTYTPDIRTNSDFDVKAGRDNSKREYYDYNRCISTLTTEGKLPNLTRYYDPLNPYECIKSFSISLPIHTRTDWSFDFSNFEYDINYGDLWFNISDTGNKPNVDRNQIGARFSNQTIYPNQWRKINNQTSFSLINPFLTKAINQESILYKPLPCSLEKNIEPIDTVNVTFKYIPHKQILSFYNQPIPTDGVQFGELNFAFSTVGAIDIKKVDDIPKSIPSLFGNNFIYDSELFTIKSTTETSSNIRLYGRVTKNNLHLLSLAQTLDNSSINIYLFINQKFYLVKNAKFGYRVNNKTYLGYPTVYEDASPYVGRKIEAFLPAYVLKFENSSFEYILKKEFTNVFYDTNYFNYLKTYDLSAYFLDNYQEQFDLKSNVFLDNYNSSINFYPTNDILISKEFSYSPIILKNTVNGKILEHKTKILNKYIYMDSTNGYKYVLLRLIPYGGSIFDYGANIQNPILKPDGPFCVTVYQEIKRPIYNEYENLLKDKKWGDLYGYHHYKSFDIANRIDQVYDAPSLAYDNILYQIGRYYDYYLSCYNDIFDTKLYSGFMSVNVNNYLLRKKVGYYLHSTSNRKYDTSLIDYKYPFMDLIFYPESSSTVIGFGLKPSGSMSFKDVRLIDENYAGSEDINFWIDLPQNAGLELEPAGSHTDSVIKSEGFKIHEPPYVLKSINYAATNIEQNIKCTSYIRPEISVSQQNRFLNSNTDKLLLETSIEYQPRDQRDIYCNSDFVENCSTTCNITPVQFYKYNTFYDVKSYDTETITAESIPSKVYFTVGQGSFYNYPYIARTRLNTESLQNKYIPNLTATNELINKNIPMIPEEELSKQHPYSEDNNDPNCFPVDSIANEMLFRLYYGSNNPINLETIGKKDITTYHQDKKLASFQNLIQSNTTILPQDIYKLIPYEYDKNTSSYLQYNGTINIGGIPKAGDSISVRINNKTFNIQLVQLDDGIYILVDGKKALYKRTKIISKGLHPILRGSGATVVPTADTTYTLVGTCFIYGGKDWTAGSYMTKIVIYGDDGKSYDIGALYKQCIREGVLNFSAEGAELVKTPRACCWASCSDPACDSHGIVFPENAPVLAASKEYKVSLGGRGTFRPGLCIGTEGQSCGFVSARFGGISTSPVFRRGGGDSLAGGAAPRDPLPIFPNCGFEGCGNLCLPKQYTDKYGERPYLNNRRALQLGDGHPGFTPCECVPKIIQPCLIPGDDCYQCTKTDSEIFTYNYEYGKYKYNNMRGINYKQTSPDGPKLIKQASYSPSVSLCTGLNWSAINQSSRGGGTEVCGITESVYQDANYDIYESTTTINNPADFKCPEHIVSINYTNNNITFTIAGDDTTTVCVDVASSGCPNINLKFPNDSYYFDNNINSECISCKPQTNKLKISNEKQEWKTVIQERIGVLGYLITGPDLNNILTAGGQTWFPKQQCGPVPDPNACYERPYGSVGTTLQCGKQGPDSYPWRYCINCRIPGSNSARLISIQGGTALEQYTYGGVVTDCIPVGPASSALSPQFSEIREQYIENWKTKMRYAYSDVHPCHNNKNLNEEDIIEGVLRCEDLEFDTVTYPGLAYRRTANGAESTGYTLEVLVAFYRYTYKRPVTIDDELVGDYYCDTYNVGGASSGPPTFKPNIVEKYVNDGPCKDDITCVDTNVEQCDNTNYCCRTNKPRGG